MPTQRREEKRVREHTSTQERERPLALWLLFLYIFSSPLGLLLLLSRISRVRLRATPWTAAHQALPSMGFSRQEYWSRLPLPSPPPWACPM